MQTTRVGVVGAGGIAREHLSLLSSREDVVLVGVADLSAATARWAAERWGASGWYTDHLAMLAEGVDVVHVLTPPETHPSIAKDALVSGANVIVEKPLARTRAELLELQDVALAHGRWLLEDHNYRWNDGVQWLLDQVSGGGLGEVRDVEVSMSLPIRDGGVFADPHLPSSAHRLPAGALHDFLPHLAYLGLLFAPGAEAAERIAAFWSNHGGEDGLWSSDDLDAVVVHGRVHLRLRFSAQTQPDSFTLAVRGTLGDASIDLFQPFKHLRLPRPAGKQLTPLINQVANGAGMIGQAAVNFRHKVSQRTNYHGLERFLGLVYDALATGAPLPLQFSDIDRATLLIDRLLEGAR